MDRVLVGREKRGPVGYWIGGVAALVVATIALSSLWLRRGAGDVPDDAAWVEVQAGPLSDRVAGLGEFVSTAQRELTTGDGGTVELLVRKAGDAVKAGDEILRLANPKLQLEVEAAVSAARSLEIERQKAELASDRAVEEALIAVENARVNARTADSERAMTEELQHRQVVSRLQFEQALAKADQAANNLASLSRLLALARRQAQGEKAFRAEAVKLAELQRDRLRERLDGLSIRAPEPGLVKAVRVQLGDTVSAGAALATVGPASPDAVRLRFPQSALDRLAAGVAVDILLGEQHWAGRVVRVAPDPRDGLVTVEAALATMPEAARIGMAVRGDAVFGQLPNVVYARSAFTRPAPGQALKLFRKRGGEVTRLALNDVQSIDGALVFVSGVQKGDLIAIDGQLGRR